MSYKDLSLEYLYNTQKGSNINSDLLEAIICFSRPVLDFLKTQNNLQAYLHEISKETGIEIKDLYKIIPSLEESELINEVTRNDIMKLTQKMFKKDAGEIKDYDT